MADDDPYEWSSDQVRSQLCSSESDLHGSLHIKPILNLQILDQALQDNDIDGESLLALEDANVKDDLGIASFGQRREIRKIILHLRAISSIHQETSAKHPKRRLSQQDDESTATSDSKRRRIQSLNLEQRPMSPNTSSTERDHTLQRDQTAEPLPRPSEPQKRRIQPQNISTEPITKTFEDPADVQPGHQPTRPSNVVNGPGDFDPEELSDEWLDFLDRHAEDPDEIVMRPYNESDSEKELDSADDASFLEELESQEMSPCPHLSAEEINNAIDEALQEYEMAWNSHKRPKKHKTALRRWMQAAKARTRKPQQNSLHREIDALQFRLAKLRQSIADVSMDYHKISEVKRNCLNLRLTVEDIAEKNYYLESLNSNDPPAKPDESLEDLAPEERLSEGEELLESSDSAEEPGSDDELDIISEMSLASDDESGLSLPYDPADHEWYPNLPSTEPRQLGHTTSPQTNTTVEVKHVGAQETFVPSDVPDLALPATPPQAATFVPPQSTSGPPLENRVVPSPKTPRTLTMIDNEEDDSDLDRLPRNKYRNEGETWDTAITLGSSPSRSDDQATFTDHSIQTPPLNPTPIPDIKREKTVSLNFPPVQELRGKKWAEINGNARLALCKIVYRTDREIARSVLQFISPLSKHVISQRLRAGICNIQDTPEEDVAENISHPDPLIVLTFFYVVYAHKKGFKEFWKISEQALDEAFEMVDSESVPFDKLLRPLLRHYIGTGTPATSQPFSQQRKAQQSYGHDPSDIGRRPEDAYKAWNAMDAEPSTPPPRNIYTDTDSDPDERPSSLKKRKRRVEQNQEALSQQRDDRFRVREQEKRRQMMMDKLHSQEAIGEDRRVIVNSVEEVPILLDQHIARRIKSHQETGVQFIWRELVEDKKQQGCLLAHTMGLGKTMQVISFLVTLAQCNTSQRSEVRALIPHKLRSGRILILCPASLVDNWYDELMMWVPPDATTNHGRGLLGDVFKISGSRQFKIETVKKWKKQPPGVLIIGYESLRSLLVTKKVSDEDKQYLEKALLQDPCIVVGDEAHKMKNAKSSISKLAQQFKTNSRIALTGSPLNNHLEEYHTMIDWIAPGYLGTLVQFKAKYSEPIERGLFAESTRYEKRKSLERLYVLKRDLAPKIDRKDISAIAHDMPQKTEFFITVPLTELQKAMYGLLIRHVLCGLSSGSNSVKASNARLWSWLSILSWLCNHPTILTRKLEKDEDDPPTALETDDVEIDGAPANLNLDQHPMMALLPQFQDQYADLGVLDDMDNPSLSTRALVTKLLIQESVKKGERVLLFSHSIPTLNYLQDMLDDLQYKYLRIDGSVRSDQRQAATKEFNNVDNDHMVFLISTRAGGLGLNLQGATRVIIYDFGFNPMWEEQAIGRAYRLGQKKPVFVYRFRAGGSFEDIMYNKSIFKTQLFSRVVDQKNVVRQTSRNVKDYLFEPKEADQQDLTECLGKDELLDNVVEMIPGAVRDLILTETFQREDEDDELTAEEKRAADEEVELERLQRTNPEEYRAKKSELQKAQLQRTNAIPQALAQNFHQSPMQSHGDYVHGLFSNSPRAEELPVRNAARANEEKMEGWSGSVSVDEGSTNSGENEGAQSKPPGCEAQ